MNKTTKERKRETEMKNKFHNNDDFDDKDDDDDYYPNDKNSRKIKIERTKHHNRVAKQMIEEGFGRPRVFKEKKKTQDKSVCRKKIRPEDFMDD